MNVIFPSLMFFLYFALACYAEVEVPALKLIFDTVKKTTPEDFLNEETFRVRELSYDDTKITISGSRQPTQDLLKKLADKAKQAGKKFYVLDLRQEMHFLAPLTLGGANRLVPISLHSKNYAYNWFKPTGDVMAQEEKAVEIARNASFLSVWFLPKKLPEYDIKKYTINPTKTVSEKWVVESLLDSTYVRLAATDHQRPSDMVVDHFVTFFRSIPSFSWVHFHCRGGRGRTTTFMILFDMMQTKGSKNLEDYYTLQKDLGGSDLKKPMPKKGSDDIAHRHARVHFINHFYNYVKSPTGFSAGKGWSDWLKDNPMALDEETISRGLLAS
jgi:hypothetical protein